MFELSVWCVLCCQLLPAREDARWSVVWEIRGRWDLDSIPPPSTCGHDRRQKSDLNLFLFITIIVGYLNLLVAFLIWIGPDSICLPGCSLCLGACLAADIYRGVSGIGR